MFLISIALFRTTISVDGFISTTFGLLSGVLFAMAKAPPCTLAKVRQVLRFRTEPSEQLSHV